MYKSYWKWSLSDSHECTDVSVAEIRRPRNTEFAYKYPKHEELSASGGRLTHAQWSKIRTKCGNQTPIDRYIDWSGHYCSLKNYSALSAKWSASKKKNEIKMHLVCYSCPAELHKTLLREILNLWYIKIFRFDRNYLEHFQSKIKSKRLNSMLRREFETR